MMTTTVHVAHPNLVQPLPPPLASALFKCTPQDFIVHEILPETHAFSHQGEHLWLHLEKTGLNTLYLAQLLAKWAQCPLSDVGYSGIKDRHAVTRQWFSLRLPKGAPKHRLDTWLNARLQDTEQVQVLTSAWHQRKLNRATHQHNHFRITLKQLRLTDGRALDEQACTAIDEHLNTLSVTGVPNYFGEQRFGQSFGNLQQFLALSSPASRQAKKAKQKSQAHNGLFISAARSHLFNAILSARVADGTWRQALAGDVFNIDGTGTLFLSDGDPTLGARVAAGEIHPTAPLYGLAGGRDLLARHQAADLEARILCHPSFSPFADKLQALGVKQARRALVLKARHLTWHWQDDTLVLDFSLLAGGFATALLAALIAQPIDAHHT